MRLLQVVFMLFPLVVFAGNKKPYEWENTRTRFPLTEKEKENQEFVLRQHIQYDYELEDNQFVMYSTIHRIILVNSSEAIQKNNRIYISMNNTLELVQLKARSINRDGKVVNFDLNNLKEIKEEDGNKSYRIFAMEGVEIGSEVEYFFTRKMEGSLFDRVYLQNDVPVKTSSFLLTCPSHLKFDFKSYNGFPEVAREEGEERNVYKASMQGIESLREEPFSRRGVNRKRVEFKLAYNTARSKARLYTWDDAAKNFFTRMSALSKDEDKAVDKFYRSIGDKPSDKTEVRIKNIEEEVKATVRVDKDGRGQNTSELQSILKYKIASNEGITRLMFAIFNKASIPVHLVITCSREQVMFDGDFDSWAYLDEYVLYFPQTKAFLSPYEYEYRYPLINADHTAQKGLFIEPVEIGTIKSGLASIRDIPAADYSLNYDNLDLEVKFSADLASNEVLEKRRFGGYNGAYLTPFYPLMSKEDQKNLVEEMVKQNAPDARISEWTAGPKKNELHDEFALDVKYTSLHFLEKAGPRLLLKVGALIGPQTEMYRDDKRVLPVENDYNRLYRRQIRITIPDGYVLKNPDDLKFDVRYRDNNNTPFVFISTYTLKGNLLQVDIEEYYREISVTVARYEDFRKVVNAAADFNKVTLVLEKKK